MASGDRKPARLFNTKDFEQFRVLTRDGKTVAQAAAILEFSPQTIYRHLREDQEWREVWRDDQQFARELLADNVRGKMVERAFDDEFPQTQRALEKVAEWYLPEARQKLEVTGGEPIRVEVESTDDEAARVLHVLAGAGLLALRAQGNAHPTLDPLHPAPLD